MNTVASFDLLEQMQFVITGHRSQDIQKSQQSDKVRVNQGGIKTGDMLIKTVAHHDLKYNLGF